MLQPTRTKFRKAHKGRIHGLATSGATLAFGQFGLKAVEPERITARQIEGARRARMGPGKGPPEFWAARVKPGRVLFEIDGVPLGLAREALALAAAKLP